MFTSIGLVTIGSDKKATTLTDFDNLSTAMASVKPSGPNSASYSPTNSPQACPTTDTWKAATALPPTPNEAVCNCMVSNLTCVAKSSLSDDDVTSQFDYICNPKLGNFCSGVNANGSTGKYGAYSMCSANQRLSFAFNQYYLDQTATNTDNNNPCEFSGAASTVRPKVASSCTSIIDQAGAAGTGTITNAPSVTGKSSSTGSGGGSSSSSSKGAAVIVGVPEFDFGILKLAGYLVSAMLVGAGVVLY